MLEDVTGGQKNNLSCEFKPEPIYHLWFVVKVLWKYCRRNTSPNYMNNKEYAQYHKYNNSKCHVTTHEYRLKIRNNKFYYSFSF